MRDKVRPSELEMQVLSVLWAQGAMTVRDVLQRLPDGKKRAYTTVLSVMQVMEKKGLIDHETRGVTHVYRPIVTQRQVCRPLMKDLLRNIFGGSPARAMQYLLADATVSAEELDEMKRLVDEASRKERHDRKEQADNGEGQ